MHYEVHGEGEPLVLVHGALSATGTSFGPLLPGLAARRRVIAVELQGHGRTADVPDRPLRIETLAQDVAELLDQLGIERADLLGYSIGAAIVLELAVRRPDLARKLVLISASLNPGGLHPGMLDGIEGLTPDALAGTPFEAEYLATAPNPQDWPVLVAKVKDLDRHLPDMPAEVYASIPAAQLIILGDSDIVRPEHAVEMFRLLGGGVAGDVVPMPASQLAILPGTTHIGAVQRTDMLLAMILPFLDTTN